MFTHGNLSSTGRYQGARYASPSPIPPNSATQRCQNAPTADQQNTSPPSTGCDNTSGDCIHKQRRYCVNCKGPHAADSRQCPVWEKRRGTAAKAQAGKAATTAKAVWEGATAPTVAPLKPSNPPRTARPADAVMAEQEMGEINNKGGKEEMPDVTGAPEQSTSTTHAV